MKRILSIAIMAILLLPAYSYAHGDHGHRDYGHRDYGYRDYGHKDYGYRDYGHGRDKQRNYYSKPDYRQQPKPHYRQQLGWDIHPRKARNSEGCYRYSLYVSGGRGSARIASLPGKPIIQVTNGQKRGYVCLSGPATLELGKLSSPHVQVELNLEDIGTFYFKRGDRGSRLKNNWLRSYWKI